MLELIALTGVLFAAAALLALLAVVGFLLKLVFKILLFPIGLLFGLLKGILLLVLVVVGLIVAPVVLGVLLVLTLPLLLLFGLAGLGWAMAAA